MKISIVHEYNKPADIVWNALKDAISNSPDFQDKHIHWGDTHAEGKYAGCKITLDAIKKDAENTKINTEIEGPWILLAPLKGKITSEIKKELSSIKLS
ncbi:MAG: hypothetical protein U9N73_01220 [Candidatus Auribacterota bacterium]|nr:hypothetical protein [Candidatus Auribacterota bacterium]